MHSVKTRNICGIQGYHKHRARSGDEKNSSLWSRLGSVRDRISDMRDMLEKETEILETDSKCLYFGRKTVVKCLIIKTKPFETIEKQMDRDPDFAHLY